MIIHLDGMGLGGFGSCHSLGIAVGLSGYGMCQMRGAIRSTIFLKMPRVMRDKLRVGHYFLICPTLIFFLKVQVVTKPVTCPFGKSLLAECHPLDDQIVPGPITANVLQLQEVGDFEDENRLPPLNLIRSTKLHLTTEPPISCRCC